MPAIRRRGTWVNKRHIGKNGALRGEQRICIYSYQNVLRETTFLRSWLAFRNERHSQALLNSRPLNLPFGQLATATSY
jgi:hypothetical protein